MDRFAELLSQAHSSLLSHPDAQQAVVLSTAKGSIHTLINHQVMEGGYRDENTFLRTLSRQEDTHALQLVCMWQGGCLDVPSMHLRQGLLEINENNKATQLLLQGEPGHLVKKLITTLPNQDKNGKERKI